MRSSVIIILSVLCIIGCEAQQDDEIEARGKKKKIALFVYIADLVIKKIFVLKLIYAFVFWLVLHKAGYFLGWFISVLKERKANDHEHHAYHDHEYSHGSNHYDPYSAPYRRKNYAGW